MIRSAEFSVGERNGKYHAIWKAEREHMIGPPRDTEEEAIADRDEAIRLFEKLVRARFPNGKITVAGVQ